MFIIKHIILVVSVVTMLSTGNSNIEINDQIEVESDLDVVEVENENIEANSENDHISSEEISSEFTMEENINTQVKEDSDKAEVSINIKDKNGDQLKDVRCDLMRGSDDDTKMVIAAMSISDVDGICSFSISNYAKSYIVKVYWTEDMSRSSQVTIGQLKAGDKITKDIIEYNPE